MAAKIRLKKVGRKGQPAYRVVVLDGRKPRDAKVVADIGRYDPKTDPATFQIDNEAALKWLLDGAKPTKVARDLLSKAGVMVAWDAAKRAAASAKRAGATAEAEPEAAPEAVAPEAAAKAAKAEAKAKAKAKAKAETEAAT
ncbi:MAG: 30S ribosomal protein S16 [Candidatus Bipolaricaulota bacterium]|nr:30S ribosomal protein S16 [Candidatus Bipolaricaulota bacterium]